MLHIVLSFFILICYSQPASCEIYKEHFGSYIQGNQYFEKKEVCFQNKPQSSAFGEFSRDFFEKDDDSNELTAWVATGKTMAYACLGKENKHLISMRNTYKVIAGNFGKKYQKRYWSLLTTYLDKKIVGWVDHDALIFNFRPIKNYRTNLYEKVLIKAGDAANSKALTIFTDKKLLQPETYMEDDKKKTSTIKVRAVFYVYDYFPKYAGNPSSEETTSLLINPNVKLYKDRTNEPMLLGWVHRDKVTFWNNREACEAKKGTQIRLKDESGSEFFTGDIVKQLLPYNDLRNPILKKLNNSLKIGVFTKLDRKQLQIKNELKNIRTGMEMLFIIDGTRSMTKEFEETLNAVKQISSELEDNARKSNLEQPRFAAMFYRDTPYPGMHSVQIINGQEEPANWDYCKKETFLIPMKNLSSFINQLSDHKACDCDKSIKESVYKGIINGINNCGFQSGHNNKTTRLRVIIHIGDAGDNGKNHSYEAVYDAMKKYNIFRYIAMNVSKNDNGFTNSIRLICQKLNENTLIESVLEEVKINDLKQRVLYHLQKSHRDTKILDEQIKIMSRGFAGTAEGTAGVFSKKYLEYANIVAEANAISINNYNPFQDYIEGYIDINSPIIKYLFVNRTDISIMTQFLSDLINADTDNITSRKKLWNAALKLIIGDEDCKDDQGKELSINECNKRRNGVPIPASFTRYSREHFLSLSPREAVFVNCEAKQVLERFMNLVSDKKIEIIMTNPRDCRFKFKEIKDINGDGYIIKDDKYVYRSSDGKIMREATKDDLKDLFFFKEADENVAYIPMKYLEYETKE